MEPIIERKTLASQVADRIEESLRKGLWKDHLPGLRTLAEHFGVNRKTCMAAVDLLESRNFVGPAEVGKRRLILDDSLVKKSSTLSGRRLLILSSATSVLNFEDLTLVQHCQEVWERAEGTTSMTRVDFSRYKNPGKLLRTLIDRYSANALVLVMAGEKWSTEAANLLPTYQLGGLFKNDASVSLSAFRISVEIQRVAKHLRDLGHERILLPIGDLADGLRQSSIEALAAGAIGKPANGTWEDYCPSFPEAHPEAWERYWASAFKKLNPTAVILIEDVHLLSIYGYCSANHISIPKSLSVVLLAWNPQFEWCTPKPCMNRYPIANAVYLFKQWIANGLKPTGVKYLRLDPLDGDSMAPPPGSK